MIEDGLVDEAVVASEETIEHAGTMRDRLRRIRLSNGK
jgi:hypothetical protein